MHLFLMKLNAVLQSIKLRKTNFPDKCLLLIKLLDIKSRICWEADFLGRWDDPRVRIRIKVMVSIKLCFFMMNPQEKNVGGKKMQ